METKKRKRYKYYKVGDIIGTKEIREILPSLGQNHYYRVKCIKCKRYTIMHQESLLKKRSCNQCRLIKKGRDTWVKLHQNQRQK